jgi:anti-sigma regulatory factor (Ser/Thr protein kinase)
MTVEGGDIVTGSGFTHGVLVADGDERLRELLAGQIRRSVAGGQEVVLVVGPRIRALLAGALSGLDGAVQWREPAAFAQRLGFAFESLRKLLADRRARTHPVHLITESDLTAHTEPDLPFDRAAGYLAYEAVRNDAYAADGCSMTCLWDSRQHSLSVIAGVRAAHPFELTEAGWRHNPGFLPPAAFLARQDPVPMPPAPAEVEQDVLLDRVGQLRELRSALLSWAVGCGFSREAGDDVIVAAVEVATNGLFHAASAVRVRAWRDQATLIVQCDDHGGKPIPATAGYYRPASLTTPGGRGLWLARQLADVVTVDSEPGCTRVRLYFPYSVTHRDPA